MSNTAAHSKQPIAQRYDAIIIGGGHNGLVCAAQLVKSGRKVLLLEASPRLGGMAATREFAPGFHASVTQAMPQLSRKLIDDLQLQQHGLSFAATALPTTALDLNGQHLRIDSTGLHGASDADSQAYGQYLALMKKFAAAIDPFWYKPPPMFGEGQPSDFATLGQFAWKLRKLGKEDMREFMRMIALPAQDLLDEYFQSPLLKAALSWDFLVGNKLAPRSPNNAVLNLLLKMTGNIGALDSLPLPRGGGSGLCQALAKSAEHHGAELSCGNRVKKVIVDQQKAIGVELANGTRILGRAIISNADPKSSFFKLLGAEHLDIEFTHRINRLRNHGMVAKVHLALDSTPRFTGLDSIDGRLLLAPSMQFIENAYDYAKYGEIAEQLPMEIFVPSLYDDSLAPKGKQLLSALVQYCPYQLKEGNWQEQREYFYDNVICSLEHYAPAIRGQIIAREVLTPYDLEQAFNNPGGHWHHGEFAIDSWWMNRPSYGASQYRSPVENFYLCGAGSHPGGGIMGAVGSNAANAVIGDNG